MKSGIYTITNIINNKIYVGFSKNVYERMSDHRKELRNNYHGNERLQKSWNKYGEENFLFEVLELCSPEIMPSLEHYWVYWLNSCNKEFGFNIRPTHPEGRYSHSEDSKEKLRKASTGKYWTEDMKRKSSEAKKGVKKSEAHLKKLQEGYLKKIQSVYRVQREDGKLYHSELEACKENQLSNGCITKCVEKGWRAGGYYWKILDKDFPIVKKEKFPTIEREDGLTFYTEAEACRYMGIKKGSIRSAIKGGWRANGYYWKRILSYKEGRKTTMIHESKNKKAA